MDEELKVRWQASLLILLCCLVFPLQAEAQINDKLVTRLKKTVVNVDTSVSRALNAEAVGHFRGTGFIVDANTGIIATVRHLARTSPSQVKITFENGESTEGRLLHYDIYHDVAFYQVNAAKLDFPLHEVQLGSSFALKEQDEVFLIGSNDGEAFSVKFGSVTKLVVDGGWRHSATFQTSFNSAGGSSGSPVFNAAGQVVGTHFAGTDTTALEMRIEYTKDALDQLTSPGGVRRGDIGVQLSVMLISDAQKHFHLPETVAKQIRSLRPDIKLLTYIQGIVPHSPSRGVLFPGDVVLDLEGTMVGDDLYSFDRMIDGKVGKRVSLTVYRNGERFSFTVAVLDAEKTKVRTFALFAGGVLHDLTPELRRTCGIESDGTFLSQANPGTSFSQLGAGIRDRASLPDPCYWGVVIEAVNGIPTPNLDAFIEAVRPLKNQDHIYVLVRGYGFWGRSTTPRPITLQLNSDPLKVFTLSSETLDWIEVDGRSIAATR